MVVIEQIGVSLRCLVFKLVDIPTYTPRHFLVPTIVKIYGSDKSRICKIATFCRIPTPNAIRPEKFPDTIRSIRHLHLTPFLSNSGCRYGSLIYNLLHPKKKKIFNVREFFMNFTIIPKRIMTNSKYS